MNEGAQAVRQLEEHTVRRQDSDPRVEPREPIDVHHEERQRVVGEPCAKDLSLEDCVERLPVE